MWPPWQPCARRLILPGQGSLPQWLFRPTAPGLGATCRGSWQREVTILTAKDMPGDAPMDVTSNSPGASKPASFQGVSVVYATNFVKCAWCWYHTFSFVVFVICTCLLSSYNKRWVTLWYNSTNMRRSFIYRLSMAPGRLFCVMDHTKKVDRFFLFPLRNRRKFPDHTAIFYVKRWGRVYVRLSVRGRFPTFVRPIGTRNSCTADRFGWFPAFARPTWALNAWGPWVCLPDTHACVHTTRT